MRPHLPLHPPVDRPLLPPPACLHTRCHAHTTVWTAIDYVGDSYSGSADGDVVGPIQRTILMGPILIIQRTPTDCCLPSAPPRVGVWLTCAHPPRQDYLAGRHPWPWHISFCGDLDIVGQPKPQSVYRSVLWGVRRMGMLVHAPVEWPEHLQWWGWPQELPSWTWPGDEGKGLGVRVFARGCESAHLLLNGKLIATAPFQDNLTAVFDSVPYAAGTLEALCVNGTAALPGVNATLRTAGTPAALALTVDRASIRHEHNDLAYVTIRVVDTSGHLVPDAAMPVTLEVAGVGLLIAVGNGDPSDPASFVAPVRNTWRGQALAILQPTGPAAGAISLKVAAPGLASAQVVVTTKR